MYQYKNLYSRNFFVSGDSPKHSSSSEKEAMAGQSNSEDANNSVKMEVWQHSVLNENWQSTY